MKKQNSSAPHFQWKFLLPKFWLTWCVFLLLRIAMFLPRKKVMALGGALGDRMRRRNHKRRHNAEVNIAMCFPELDARAREQLVAEHFRDYARGILDLGLTLWGSRARLDSLCARGLRESVRAVSEGGRVIVVAYHTTTLDMSAALLARARPNVSMMKRDGNALIAWQLWRGRRRHGDVQLLMRDQGLRAVVRALRAGRACFFIPDEDLGAHAHTVFAPFFGVQTATLTVVARLARACNARVLPCAARLDAKSGRYEISVGAPLANFPCGDETANAAALNAAMEKLIRRAPAQYMWSFRWFARSQDGAPSPYEKDSA